MDKKYYLDFTFGRVEILEPIGYDGSNTILKQSDNRYARDVMYGSDKVKLKFQNEYGEPCGPYILDNGTIVKHLGSGFNLLLEENRNFGSESDVKFIVSDGTDEFSMSLNFSDAETDDYSFIELSLIQEDTLAVYKRQEKKPIDLFSDKNLEGNTITPVQTLKVLFKAKPITQVSEWKDNGTTVLGASFSRNNFGSSTNTDRFGANNANVVLNYGIENTLSFLSPRYALNTFGFPTGGNSFTYLEATDTLTNLQIKITDLVAYTSQLKNDFFSNIVTSGSGYARLVLKYGDDITGSSLTTIILYEKTFGFVNNTPSEYLPNEINAFIPILNQGEKVYIYLEPFTTATFNQYNQSGSLAEYQVTAIMEKMNVEITATSTGVNSVTNAVRYIDAIKQVNKSIGTLPVLASHFDVGGKWYDNVIFNGKLIRQITNEPFLLSLENLRKNISGEFNSDYQVSNDNFFIGHESDFYKNEDLGGFLTLPDTEFKKPKNDRFLINEFSFIYENYEKDKDEKNTLDAIHTEFKTSVPQKKSENTREIKCNFARDPYYGETIRRRNTLSSTTAYDSDDKVIMYDIIELAPGSRGNINFVLKYEIITPNTLKILSNNNFRWDLLGFKVNDNIIIDSSGFNANLFKVIEITQNIVTLQFLNFLPSSSSTGETRLVIDYPITDVAYTIRTNEGLTYAENLLNSDNFGNLRYSIKRNILNNYSEYLATSLLFTSSKEILKTEFKANGEATTRFVDEIEETREDENFTVDLSKKILTQNLIETTVYCDFSTAKNLLDDIQNKKGFIRVIDNNERVLKGYVKEFDRNDKFNELNLLLEEKFESDFLVITYDGTNFTINGTVYETERRYNIYNDKIQFFDKNNLILCNRTLFNKVQYNGVVYSSIDELVTALENG